MLTKLILCLIKIGIIGYGGGSAVIPYIKDECVDKYGIITDDEFIEILAICNVLPGPMITKYVSVLGYKVSGIKGAILAVFALCMPSIIMLMAIITFVKTSGTNENVANMISCIFPVVSVIIFLMTIQFFNMSKSKFSILQFALLVAIFAILIIILKVNLVIIIFGLIFLCFIIPKAEGEND